MSDEQSARLDFLQMYTPIFRRLVERTEQMQHEFRMLREETDSLLAEHDSLLAEHDSLLAEHDSLLAERGHQNEEVQRLQRLSAEIERQEKGGQRLRKQRKFAVILEMR